MSTHDAVYCSFEHRTEFKEAKKARVKLPTKIAWAVVDGKAKRVAQSWEEWHRLRKLCPVCSKPAAGSQVAIADVIRTGKPTTT